MKPLTALKEELKDELIELQESAADGWRRLKDTASSALTRFRARGERDGDDEDGGSELERVDADVPSARWAMLTGDIYEDDRRVVVRLEIPGMEKSDFTVDVVGQALVVKGTKRFERESDDGRWRVLQSAWGSFHRVMPLPAPVHAGDAKASYRHGVLRIELPKAKPGRRRSVNVAIS